MPHGAATAGYGDAKIQTRRQQGARQQRLPDLDRDAAADRGRRGRRPLDQQLRRHRRTSPATSIGPTFGKTVANSAIIAIIASLLVISRLHRAAVRVEVRGAGADRADARPADHRGVYSLTGREVTTATVAALLTILGYSLYDTIIVFDRIRENVPRMPRAAFSQIVNRSMSEVLTRSLATSFCTLLPVLALLLFGGETLKDFAFALLVGVALGRVLVDLHRLAGADALEGARAGLRAPRAQRIEAERGGVVPAYAIARRRRRRSTSSPKRKRRRRGAAPASTPGGAGRRSRGGVRGARRATSTSSDEAAAAHRARRAGAEPRRAPAAEPRQPEPGDRRAAAARARGAPAAGPDAARTACSRSRARSAASRHARNRRHGRYALMAMLAWVMMGLALWHFTIFLPDRFWGGIVGAFLGALIGASSSACSSTASRPRPVRDRTCCRRSRRSPAR